MRSVRDAERAPKNAHALNRDAQVGIHDVRGLL